MGQVIASSGIAGSIPFQSLLAPRHFNAAATEIVFFSSSKRPGEIARGVFVLHVAHATHTAERQPDCVQSFVVA
jgi:hypothetical protein